MKTFSQRSFKNRFHQGQGGVKGKSVQKRPWLEILEDRSLLNGQALSLLLLIQRRLRHSTRSFR